MTLRKQVAEREDDVARKQARSKEYVTELREFKKGDRDLEEFIDAMKKKMDVPKFNGGRNTKQDCLDLMNKYIRALELWGKYKRMDMDYEEAARELTTAKEMYEAAKSQATAAEEEEDSDGSLGGY